MNRQLGFFISVMLLFPLGFFMGIPFPRGIRALDKRSQEDIPWMWGLNGTYSLLGSVLAMVIAMSLGFNAAFLFGGLIYLTIFATGHVKPKKEIETKVKEEEKMEEKGDKTNHARMEEQRSSLKIC